MHIWMKALLMKCMQENDLGSRKASCMWRIRDKAISQFFSKFSHKYQQYVRTSSWFVPSRINYLSNDLFNDMPHITNLSTEIAAIIEIYLDKTDFKSIILTLNHRMVLLFYHPNRYRISPSGRLDFQIDLRSFLPPEGNLELFGSFILATAKHLIFILD